MNWLEFLNNYAPLLMIATTILLLPTGYPVAFILAGVGLAAAVLASVSGVFPSFMTPLANLPAEFLGFLSSSQDVLAIPLVLLLAIFLERSGLSPALRNIVSGRDGAYENAALHCDGQGRKAERWNRRPVGTLGFMPSSLVLMILLAILFGIPVTVLFSAILLPYAILLALFLIDLFLSNWMKKDHRLIIEKSQDHARRSTGEQPVEGALIQARESSEVKSEPISNTDYMQRRSYYSAELRNQRNIAPLWAIGLFALLALEVSGLVFLGLASFNEALALACMLALGASLITGRFRLAVFADSAHRAVIQTARYLGVGLAAILFLSVFGKLGGIEQFRAILSLYEIDTWGCLLLFLVLFIMLGFVLDWVSLLFILVPLCAPVLVAMDFNSLDPLPNSASLLFSQLPATSNHLIIEGGLASNRIWIASLLWLVLLVAIRILQKQFSLFPHKRLAPAARKPEDRWAQITPFMILQVIGVALVLYFPALVLGLPRLLFS